MKRLSAVLACVTVATGCVLTVDPVIPRADALFDARLLGAWEEANGSDRAVVSLGADSIYDIAYTSNHRSAKLHARLGRIGSRTVLDVWPSEQELPDIYQLTFVAGHLLFALDIGVDEVEISQLERDTIAAALQTGSLTLGRTQSENQIILHGTTAELRRTLSALFASGNRFGKPGVFRRARSVPRAAVTVPCFESSAWREADRLFHSDPHWLGADVASSIDLGGGRILWLFGDSWIDPTGRGRRNGARMVSNSVAIQRGTNPATSSMTFYWGKAATGTPDAMFPDRAGESLWFGSGVRVDDVLVLFFARTIRNTGEGLGFEHVGWTAVLVDNPDAEPSAWRVRHLETPVNPLGILVGFAAAARDTDHVYAFGSQNPVKTHPIFVARWPVAQVRRGNLMQPQWWGGERVGWISDSSSVQRWPLFENAQSELTIHSDPATQRFIAVHTRGFGSADVVMRAAPALTGPWSPPRMVYHPPEYDRANVMIYAGKAHPYLTGADLPLTYATNTFKFEEHSTDPQIYYPRFVRLTRCAD